MSNPAVTGGIFSLLQRLRYVVLDISLKPSQGSQVVIQHGGGTKLATLRGMSLITEDGEAIEGEALDDVTVIGVVTFTISDVRRDNAVV
ncbi:hypothetical protein [Klebsiella variicola]|uniref:hypothetical protein n=1 Tax=Klebsiella variicola TaxID=244366 RepID=UPI0027D7B6C3|nr:hypothetical protein [Klebsiella variicola]